MKPVKLRITLASKTASAILYNNSTSKDFISLLPLTLTLEDYNNTEKVANLSKKLSTKNTPIGFKPSAGDLTYYLPWGNIALFYKDFDYAIGLISLGKITIGLEYFNTKNSTTVTIALET